MSLPQDLTLSLEKHLSKISRSMLITASADLTNRYRSPNRNQLQTFMKTDQHRLSYLAARLPATFAVLKRVLEECQKNMPDFSPHSIADIGAGPGTATWASANAFSSINSAKLYEKDEGWLKLGKSIMDLSTNFSLKNSVWKQTNLEEVVNFDTSDLAILSYVVGELDLEAMKKLVANAWASVSQVLIIIEPGTPHGFERIRMLREQLIQLGAFVVAPCPHNNKCLMSGSDWCHFSERLERSLLHKTVKAASMGYEDEKYSYVVVSKTSVALPQARILRHPQHHSGHTEFVLCTSEGLEKRTISRRHKEEYKKAKKLEWGDCLSIRMRDKIDS
jgi:ribosomal protein RSM22 (predicted rRNA methylase)